MHGYMYHVFKVLINSYWYFQLSRSLMGSLLPPLCYTRVFGLRQESPLSETESEIIGIAPIPRGLYPHHTSTVSEQD